MPALAACITYLYDVLYALALALKCEIYMSFCCYKFLHNIEYFGQVIQDIDILTTVNCFGAGAP